jgi:hypothetical protein
VVTTSSSRDAVDDLPARHAEIEHEESPGMTARHVSSRSGCESVLAFLRVEDCDAAQRHIAAGEVVPESDARTEAVHVAIAKDRDRALRVKRVHESPETLACAC